MSTQKPSVALWMPVFIKDARARASTLSHIEHSALNYLYMLFWEHDGSIPDDDKAIAKALKLTVRQWQAMRPTLLSDCTIAQGRINRPETISELAKARRNIAQNQQPEGHRPRHERATAVQRTIQRPFNHTRVVVVVGVVTTFPKRRVLRVASPTHTHTRGTA